MIERRSWSDFYFRLAREFAEMSRDPSTKVGAVIVRPDKTVAGGGFNGFARGVEDSPARYADRDFKIAAVLHAESNAILNAGGSVKGCDLYVTPLMPCAACASLIVQSGILRVFAEQYGDVPERWQTNMMIARMILEEGGVELTVVDRHRPIGKRRVIIESPFAGDEEANVAYAKEAMMDCLIRNESPLASHVLYASSGVLDDAIEGERNLGMEAGLAWTERADAVVVYEDLGVSQGMMRGIRHALDRDIPVEYRKIREVAHAA